LQSKYFVTLTHIIEQYRLNTIYLPCEADQIQIGSAEVNRPGLQLAGFYEFFDSQRVQIIGKSEVAFLRTLGAPAMEESLTELFSRQPVVTIVTHGVSAPSVMVKLAKRFRCPLLMSNIPTSEFVAALISLLNVELAPRQTRHGVLVEVHGEGVLLQGESGVGKSETAMELVKRGHRLIADDAVEIRRVSARTLVGTSPENIRHYMELRGIGIINVRQIFGIGAVKVTQQIDMVIQLEHWDPTRIYNRMGIQDEYIEILGNRAPLVTIPIKPGRNLAIIIEVAAMNNRQKMMGYNSAQELMARLGLTPDTPSHQPIPPGGKYE
jgi:Serine kinase of the HPr protein, regulates carbohydrate metabolism